MNAFRKLVSGRLAAQAKGAHLSADTLAAFAENALPHRERESVLLHLGQCGDCRQVLFLSQPPSAELQQVLAVAPARSSFAFRWGAVAAAVVVVAAVFVGTHEFRNQLGNLAQKSAPAAAPSAIPQTVAREKMPAELDAMRTEGYAAKAAVPPASAGHAEPKHATAKPQQALTFDQSDEVHVASNNGALRGSTVDDRSARNEVAGAAPNMPAPAIVSSVPVAPASVQARDDKQKDLPYAAAGALAKSLAGTSSFSGVVVDPAGALVSNAKVTAISPAGAKTAISDSEGKFYFGQMPAGNYSLKAEANGFRTTELQSLALVANKPSNVRLTLSIGASSGPVAVTGELVTADSAEVATSKLDTNLVAQGQAIGGPVESAVSSRKKTANQVAMQKAAMPASSLPQWTLSSLGAVQRSFDLGRTWQIVPVGSGAAFHALAAVGTHVWAGGKAGLLYHSPDSGHNWAQVTPTDAGQKLQSDILHIDFSDVANGSIHTANGQQWTTSDSGQTWHVK